MKRESGGTFAGCVSAKLSSFEKQNLLTPVNKNKVDLVVRNLCVPALKNPDFFIGIWQLYTCNPEIPDIFV